MGNFRFERQFSLQCGRVASLAVGMLLAATLAVGVIPTSANEEGAAREIELHLDADAPAAAETVRVRRGHPLALVVTTDSKVVLHVHGLDVSIPVSPGQASRFLLQTPATGRFPVTMHDSGNGHATVLYIEVHPD